VQGSRDLDADREHVLDRKRPILLDEPAKVRTVEMLEQQVGIGAVEDGVESPDKGGMRKTLEQLGLPPELADGRLVLEEVGSKDLRDCERVQPLVPDEIHVIAPAPSERLERGAPRGDLRALLELPTDLVRARLPGLL